MCDGTDIKTDRYSDIVTCKLNRPVWDSFMTVVISSLTDPAVDHGNIKVQTVLKALPAKLVLPENRYTRLENLAYLSIYI